MLATYLIPVAHQPLFSTVVRVIIQKQSASGWLKPTSMREPLDINHWLKPMAMQLAIFYQLLVAVD